jgi:hypothetical protein
MKYNFARIPPLFPTVSVVSLPTDDLSEERFFCSRNLVSPTFLATRKTTSETTLKRLLSRRRTSEIDDDFRRLCLLNLAAGQVEGVSRATAGGWQTSAVGP